MEHIRPHDMNFVFFSSFNVLPSTVWTVLGQPSFSDFVAESCPLIPLFEGLETAPVRPLQERKL